LHDFVEGLLQKYFESCNTANTKRKLSLLNFYSTEHCRRYNDDYVRQHASNKVQVLIDSSDAKYNTVTGTYVCTWMLTFRCL